MGKEMNSHPRDTGLHFDAATHTYTHLPTGRNLLSVTTLVERCFEQFDAIYWSERKAPSMGISPEELRRQWDEKRLQAAALGTELHGRIEKYYNGCEDASAMRDTAYRHFRTFADSARLKPYRTEWRIYDEDLGVAGTLDFLAYSNKPGIFDIWDWKRSDKMVCNGVLECESRWRKTAKEPINHISDTTFMHYALQLSIYRYILERKYGIQIGHAYLGIFHPTYDRPYTAAIPYLNNEAEKVMKFHCKK